MAQSPAWEKVSFTPVASAADASPRVTSSPRERRASHRVRQRGVRTNPSPGGPAARPAVQPNRGRSRAVARPASPRRTGATSSVGRREERGAATARPLGASCVLRSLYKRRAAEQTTLSYNRLFQNFEYSIIHSSIVCRQGAKLQQAKRVSQDAQVLICA